MKNNFLNFKPIQKFIKGIGKDAANYFGRDLGSVVGLGDDGFFYGFGLYQWLSRKNKKINFANMDDDGAGLEEERIKGRKVLIVDNDIVTGKSYKRVMEIMRAKKERLKIKDIKFAALCDRIGLADFYCEGYQSFAPWSLKDLDGIDLKIIQALTDDGRKSFVDIAKNIRLSQVAVKNRVEKLIKQKILKIQGLLNLEKLYSVSANIEIEADPKTVSELIERFEKSPLVYHLVKTSGRYNLLVSIVVPNLENIESFIAKEIRIKPGIKHIEVSVGELPIIPKTWSPPIV